MSRLSVILSRAVDRGRTVPQPADRASLLAALLRKRATASNQGATEMEAMLREQIRWSLPIQRDGQRD